MGTDDIFKKNRRRREKRKHDFKIPKTNSYLIVTEGKKTEPLYLEGIVHQIKKKVGGTLDIVEVPIIKIEGGGCSTCKLIEKADALVKRAPIMYQHVWVVFDKDDFFDFDEAIDIAEKKGYKVGWSNQSFEYWAYLHFYYSDVALHRWEWANKLDEIFKKNKIGTGKYEKNDTHMFEHLNNLVTGNVYSAISNAKRRMSGYNEKKMKASEYDPGTMLYVLVEEILSYIE